MANANDISVDKKINSMKDSASKIALDAKNTIHSLNMIVYKVLKDVQKKAEKLESDLANLKS